MYVIQIKTAGQPRYLIHRPRFGVMMWTNQLVRATRYETKGEAKRLSQTLFKDLLCDIIEVE